MEYLVVVHTTTPTLMLAEEFLKLEECEYCDTVTGAIDGIAKLEIDSLERWLTERLPILTDVYDVPRETFEFCPINTTLFLTSTDLRGNVPFWWLIEAPQPDVIRSRLSEHLREAYLVDHADFNVWLAGSTPSTTALSALEDHIFNECRIGRNSTHIIFRRFRR